MSEGVRRSNQAVLHIERVAVARPNSRWFSFLIYWISFTEEASEYLVFTKSLHSSVLSLFVMVSLDVLLTYYSTNFSYLQHYAAVLFFSIFAFASSVGRGFYGMTYNLDGEGSDFRKIRIFVQVFLLLSPVCVYFLKRSLEFDHDARLVLDMYVASNKNTDPFNEEQTPTLIPSKKTVMTLVEI
jgi:hypothetical protein